MRNNFAIVNDDIRMDLLLRFTKPNNYTKATD